MGSKFQVLFRYEDPKKIIGRAWIGLACIPVWIMSSFSSVMFSIIPVWYLHEPDLSYARTDNGGLARYICKTEWILCQKTAFLARKLAFLARKSAFFNATFFLSSSFSKELIQCIIIINKE